MNDQVSKSLQIPQDIWQAFTVLSDIECLIRDEQGRSVVLPDNQGTMLSLINHSKQHLMRIMNMWSDDLKHDVMLTTLTCNLPNNEEDKGG